jgi:hypothetical protein
MRNKSIFWPDFGSKVTYLTQTVKYNPAMNAANVSLILTTIWILFSVLLAALGLSSRIEYIGRNVPWLARLAKHKDVYMVQLIAVLFLMANYRQLHIATHNSPLVNLKDPR